MSSSPSTASDIRTWLLLILALVPTASVLGGAIWLWNVRGAEIENFQSARTPVTTTYELYCVGERLLLSASSLRAASVDDAGPSVLERAEADRLAALEAIAVAEMSLPSLIADLAPLQDEQEDDQEQALALLSGSIGLASNVLERHVAGDPIGLEMNLLITLTRDNASGLVLPFVDPGNRDIAFLYEAVGTTIRYQDQYDRDRGVLLDALEDNDPTMAEIFESVASSPLRLTEWNDLVDSRTFTPFVTDAAWKSTRPDPDSPVLIDRTEPVQALIAEHGVPETAQARDLFLLDLLALDDSLHGDIEFAMSALNLEADAHVEGLVRERWLLLFASGLMAVVAMVLSRLTWSEVLRRREVEAAHGDAMELLADKAHRDPTTGAWNRRRLEATLAAMIEGATEVGETVVLAYIDLDHFKAINDVWGHTTGDEVLRTVTGRLESFRHHGLGFEMARFGGDEFVLYTQTTSQDLSWLESLGTAIIGAVGTHMPISGRVHAVGASVGIATSNVESTIDSLLLEADSSLILAKQEQRGSAVIYNRDISRTGELVHALPAALADGEIVAHFQPVFDVITGEVIHVEALARWTRPTGETVSPMVFVPLVESYGLAEELTTTVLSCASTLVADESTPAAVRVWINVSPRELDIANFAERFVSMLATANVPPSRIGIEITETAAVRDPIRLGAELRRLRDVGVGVAIDDFGAGYSPLGFLRALPVDVVKLDRSLISHIDSDRGNQFIVIGIVGMLGELGMRITAEGAERLEEEAWLVEHGIHRVQGFLRGRPVHPSQLRWTNHEVAAPLSAVTSELKGPTALA